MVAPRSGGLTETGSNRGVYDPLGNFTGYKDHPPIGPPQPVPQFVYGAAPSGSLWPFVWGGDANYSTGCKLDGVPANCSKVIRANNSDSAKIDSISTTGGAADFGNQGIFVSAMQRTESSRPRLKKFRGDPTHRNNSPYESEYVINISFNFDAADAVPQNTDAGVKSIPAPCSVQVSWGSEIDDTGDRYGLPFVAEIKTPGRIGQIGDLTDPGVKGDLKNGGKWEVGQKTWSWTRLQFGENGAINDAEHKTHDDSPKPESRVISGRTALFFDRPGLPKNNVISNLHSGEAKFNIIVYAQRGSQYCSASFRIWVAMENGRPFLREVGGGHYR